MKKITLLFILVSSIVYAQNKTIQQELTATDTLKLNRNIEIRKVLDEAILNNILVNKDTIKLDYHYQVDVMGKIKLDSILSESLEIKNSIKKVFKVEQPFLVKPYNDYIYGVMLFHSKKSNRYYKKKGVYQLKKRIEFDQYPVFPGCVGQTNKVLYKCLSNQVGRHIARRFNVSLANSLGLKEGKHHMYVRFIIDTTGVTSKIEAKAPHPRLKAEAIKMIKSLPIIKSGSYKGEKVKVSFQLPITFIVEEPMFRHVETKKQRKQRLRRERKAKKNR